MRVKGQKGNNDATSILYLSALYRTVDMERYFDQGIEIKLFGGERIATACNKGDDLYLWFVVSGAVEVGISRSKEQLTVLFVRGENDIILNGLEGFVTFGTSTFMIKAVRNTVLIGFSYEQVKLFMRTDDAFYEDYIYATHMAMAQMGHRVDTLNHQSSSKRILLWLEKLCEANIPNASGVYKIPCNLTVDELAAILEIHYGTCNKLLRALKDLGVIDKSARYFEIRDRIQLRELLSEENPILY